MVLKVVTGKILRTLGLSSRPARLCSILGRRVELASCLLAIQNLFRPAGACRHSAFTHGLRRGLHSAPLRGYTSCQRSPIIFQITYTCLCYRNGGAGSRAKTGWRRPVGTNRGRSQARLGSLRNSPRQILRPAGESAVLQDDVELDVAFRTRGLSPDGLCCGIPGCDCVLEIGVVGQVATYGGVVAKVFVFDRWVAGSHCVEEGCLVSRHVAVTVRS